MKRKDLVKTQNHEEEGPQLKPIILDGEGPQKNQK